MPRWMPHLDSIEFLQDFGPCDWLARVTLRTVDAPYITRTVVQREFPTPGVCSYVCVPWDVDGDMGYEAFGFAKLKLGICRACGADGQQCLLTTLDSADIGDLPDMDLKNAIEVKMSKVPAIVSLYREACGIPEKDGVSGACE